MKRKIIATILLCPIVSFAESNGTVNFSGKLVSSTCNVYLNAYSSGNSGTVTLGPVPAQNLNSNGKTSGLVSFSFLISGCNAQPVFKIYFDGGPSVDNASGRLNNTSLDAGAAKNVQLELLDSGFNNKPIFIGDSNQRTSGFYRAAAVASSISYAVRYYATDQAQPGQVTSDVIYTLIYQ